MSSWSCGAIRLLGENTKRGTDIRQTDKQTHRGVYRVAPQLKIVLRSTYLCWHIGGGLNNEDLSKRPYHLFAAKNLQPICLIPLSFKEY